MCERCQFLIPQVVGSMEVEEDVYENRARIKFLSIKNSNGWDRASYIS